MVGKDYIVITCLGDITKSLNGSYNRETYAVVDIYSPKYNHLSAMGIYEHMINSVYNKGDAINGYGVFSPEGYALALGEAYLQVIENQNQ